LDLSGSLFLSSWANRVLPLRRVIASESLREHFNRNRKPMPSHRIRSHLFDLPVFSSEPSDVLRATLSALRETTSHHPRILPARIFHESSAQRLVLSPNPNLHRLILFRIKMPSARSREKSSREKSQTPNAKYKRNIDKTSYSVSSRARCILPSLR
jgi:hypothetical protein